MCWKDLWRLTCVVSKERTGRDGREHGAWGDGFRSTTPRAQDFLGCHSRSEGAAKDILFVSRWNWIEFTDEQHKSKFRIRHDGRQSPDRIGHDDAIILQATKETKTIEPTNPS